MSMPILLMIVMMMIYGDMEEVECLDIYENDPEIVDQEIRTLCSLDPNLDICHGVSSSFL